MDRQHLTDALSSLPQTDRDLAERIITNPTLLNSYSPGYGDYKAISTATDQKGASLKRLRDCGLITFLNGYWHWIAGPVSDFFAVRIANNFE